VKDLKAKALKGGLVKAMAQVGTFTLRIGSMAVLARLLVPTDFGLVAMVTAVTGVLSLMKDAGLSLATVQREHLTEAQLSTLFWLNLAVGVFFSGVCLCLAPLLAHLYHEPRLVNLTLVMAPCFFLASLGVQHFALLERQMRFSTCAGIDILALLLSSVTGAVMAYMGWRYWSLVGMALVLPAVTAVGAWTATKWMPGRPTRGSDIRSLARLGGALTFNSLVIYIAYNVDKVLLGRYWGSTAVGSYGRAYQLVNIPTENLNAAIGNVAMSALSRLQSDPDRMKSYFLKGYALLLTLTIPATVACAVFSHEIVAIVLGPGWDEAAVIVRLLSPTILVFALINPTFWLVFSLGLMRRSVHMALVIAPLVIIAYACGLSHGPRGVASAYSIAMLIWLGPHLVWATHGTMVTVRDLVRTASKPLIAGILAAGACLLAQTATHELSPISSLAIGTLLMTVVYGCTLLFVMNQKAFYFDLWRSLFGKQKESSETRPAPLADPSAP
jgi:PST family polysaccharide transporter